MSARSLRGSLLVAALPAFAACSAPAALLEATGGSEPVRLWSGVLVGALGVLTAFLGVWACARGRRPLPPAQEWRAAQRLFVLGGLMLPALSVGLLLGVGVPVAQRLLVLRDQTALTIELTAYCWGWHLHYPHTGALRENELIVPRGRAVLLHLHSEDVPHSLWLPELRTPVAALPGRNTVRLLRAERLGVSRGECVEYCGSGHPAMRLQMLVLEPEAFAARLAWPGR